MLSVKDSISRHSTILDGIWNFTVDTNNVGLAENWAGQQLRGTRPMAVPGSYNDVTVDTNVHDHVGLVWYERNVIAPKYGEDRLILRFGSVTHEAYIFVNGTEVTTHKGGYLPFEADITELVKPGEEFRLTVAVDNRLHWQSIPQGISIRMRLAKMCSITGMISTTTPESTVRSAFTPVQRYMYAM
ncbi:hypothetical protein RQN30_09875 [Arcanobacterium hippocoleae]